ncbi:MAG TPA: lysylphosphatidylglycerol synthase transmembrane domain-containing protein [Solirubrobacterales bacterium]|nr:lysylphosphatidylglycerol synthase transmembrane domain-containing protein [Solirubrobacterales bacterium]
MTPADVGSSVDSFLDASAEFFRNLAEIRWGPLAIALAMLAGMQLTRARAWQNVLGAAYPGEPVRYRAIAASYLAGAGINAIAPARAGDVTKVFLAKRQVPGSSYPAVTSSFLVQTIFDTTAGLLVFAYALTQGLLPRPPELPELPAFDIAFWAANPQLLIFTLTVVGVGFVVVFAVLARRVELFWQRVKQGVVVLTQPRRYLREVVAWQGVGWLFRFGAFWFLLEAFGIGGSVGNVMLVMSVQAVSNIVPFTPGGAGAQQALLVATLEGPSRAAVLSYSVGTQIVMAVWSVVLGFAAMLLVFRTTNWRELVRQAESDRDREQGEGVGLGSPSSPAGSRASP